MNIAVISIDGFVGMLLKKPGHTVTFIARGKPVERVYADAELVRNHKTSMLQDRERGKKMETGSLCGYFVDVGKRNGCDALVSLSFIDQAG